MEEATRRNYNQLVLMFYEEHNNPHTRRAYRTAMSEFRNYVRDNYRGLDMVRGEFLDIREALNSWIWEATSKWSENTMRMRLNAVSSFYNWLMIAGERQNNPAIKLKLSSLDAKTLPKYPDTKLADRYIACFDAIEEPSLRERFDTLLVRVLRESGLRCSEMVNLRVNDVDFDKATVFVRSGKGNRPRYSAVLPETAKMLQAYCLDADRSGEEYVFPTPSQLNKKTRRGAKLHLTTRGVYNILETYAKNFGFEEHEAKLLRSPHNWRHLWATEHVSAGTQSALIQSMAGWRDSTMLLHYMDKLNIPIAAVRR